MFKIADEICPSAMKPVADRNERSTRTLDAVRELAPKIRAASDEIEQGRRLPLHIVRADAAGGRVSNGDAASVGRTRAERSFTAESD